MLLPLRYDYFSICNSKSFISWDGDGSVDFMFNRILVVALWCKIYFQFVDMIR